MQISQYEKIRSIIIHCSFNGQFASSLSHPRKRGVFAFFDLFFFASLLGALFFFLGAKFKHKKNQATSVYEALPEGLILLDHRGCILYINRKAKRFLGLFECDLFRQVLSDLNVRSSLLDKCIRLFKRCRESKLEQSLSFDLEEPCQKSLEVIVKPLHESSLFLLLMQDSSAEYQMHQLGKEFVANASHELRTPITIVKGFAETLSELPEISEAMFQDFTEKIIRNCQRMDLLVKNLLILTDLDYLPKARLQECDLVALVDNCIYTLLALHPDINIQALQNKDMIFIQVDPDLIELALMNLLENGVKYSSPPADLTITVEDRQEEVLLSVADKGIGIPPDDLSHIFDRFYTVNKAHSRRLGGAGLGLSIVKTIVKKHDGEIAVTSELSRGSEFTLSFHKVFQGVSENAKVGLEHCD